MNSIRIEATDDFVELLGDSPEKVSRRALELIVLELYRQHELSAGRAAKILDLDKFEFIRWSGSLGIPYLDMTPEEWQQELRVLNNL